MTDSGAPRLDQLARAMAGCRKCGLAGGRTRVVPGEGPAGAKVMLVGEAPGKQEDATGRPFVGMTGERFLRPLLRELGLDPAGLFITSVAKCRPPNNRDPKPDEVAACVDAWLADQVQAVDPMEIMLLGKVPAKSLLGLTGTIASLRGREFSVFNRPARVTYHPTAGMRFPGPRKGLTEDLAALCSRLA